MKDNQKEQNRLDKERLRARREAAKESKLRRQLKAKLAKTKITNSLLETSKFEIKNSAGRLALKDEVIAAVECVEIESVDPQIPLNQDGLLQFSQNQIFDLTEKISILETEISTLQIRVNALNSLSNAWETERNLTKELITMDEDMIQKNEQKLQLIDLREFEYQADRPEFLRAIIEFFTNNPDEVLTNAKIAKHEVKRSNRMGHLIKIDANLADATILVIHDEDVLKNLEFIVTDFRSIRIDMGQNYRAIRRCIQNDQIEKSRADIIKTFSANLERINLAGAKFQDVVLTTQDSIRTMYTEFDHFQKKLLIPQPQAKIDAGASQFDQMISTIRKGITKGLIK